MRLVVLVCLIFFLSLPPSLLASESLTSLIGRLEYDQEIRGLFVPDGWFKEMGGSLLIGSAKIIPEPGRLYSLGWRPAFHLDSVSYSGTRIAFFNLAKFLAKQSRARFYLTRVQTKDRPLMFDCTVTPEGNIQINL